MDTEVSFLNYLVENLVEHTADIEIAKIVDERGILLELTVNKSDLGRVIGKRGATAQSLRTLLWALGSRSGAHYSLKIIDNERFDNAQAS